MGTTADIYMDIIIFLVVSILVIFIFKRIKTSPVLGFLIAGAIIGPHVTNIIDGVDASKHVADLGIVFLLFTIGLELSWERLRELRTYVFGIGTLQFFLTSIVFAWLIYAFLTPSLEIAILLGGGLSLSSTAIVLQVLSDRNERATRTGRVSFSILLFQDLAVVFLLVWIKSVTKSTEPLLYSIGQAFIRGTIVLVGIALIGRFLLRPLYKLMASTRSYELIMATTLLIVLSISFATDMVNLSMELGAFLAGLMLAETEYTHQIESDIRPYRALLLGLFFMTIGMDIDPHIITDQWVAILTSAFALMSIKAVLLFLITWALRLPLKTAIKTGLLMAAGGEFIFVLLSEAAEEKLIAPEILQVVNISVIISMALTPALAALGKFIGQKLPSPIGYAMRRAEEDSKDLKNHIIIGGYGSVGTYVHKLLSKHMIPHVAIDMNMRRVALGREQEGASVFFGDARRVEIYRALGADRARAILLTLGDFVTAGRAVLTLRRYFPETPIFARVMDKQQAMKLRKAGAHPVIPEAYAPSFQLAAAVLRIFNFSAEQIDQTLREFRKDNFEPDELEEKFDWEFKHKPSSPSPIAPSS